MRVNDRVSNGIVIARFQTHRLHEGHKALLKAVKAIHGRVTVFLGDSPLRSTPRNPLTFKQRVIMLQQFDPTIAVYPLADCRTNEEWSLEVDKLSREDSILYGGRDSFIPYYQGQRTCIELPIVCDMSATKMRDNVHEVYYSSEEFRAGVVFGAKNKWVNAVPCVDVAIIDHGKVLMGRKADQEAFQFIGGFVDPAETYEEAALREVKEETGLDLRHVNYLESRVVNNDWRYLGEDTKITTAFFAGQYKDGVAKAMDDIAEVKWFNFRQALPIVASHRPMLETLRGVYRL